VDVIVNPDTTEIERISIGAKDACEEESHSKSTLAMGLDTSDSRSFKVLGIIFDFLFFLSICCNNSDSVESLVCITSTLPIGFHSLLGALGKNL
jgi:hypothetical protein